MSAKPALPQPLDVSLDIFRMLCDAAGEFCSLAPWERLAGPKVFNPIFRPHGFSLGQLT